MRIAKNKLLLSCLLTSAVASNGFGVDLGTISVESSTIDDKFETKKTEVSNTATISGDKVDEAHVENIQQVLQSIPGITTEVQSGDSIKIHIRGVENQRYMGEKPGVAVVIDGVPVFERTGRVNIDLDNIESIKVVKGGASYLFGEDALSGAVIITTKRGAKYDNTYVNAEAGSYGYKKVVARQGFSDENYNGHIQVSERKADGYWEDSDYEAKYLNGKYQYYIDDTSDITVGLEYSKRKKDSHGTVKGVTQAETNPESKDDGTGSNRDYTRKYEVDLLKLFATYSKDLSDKSNLLVNVYQYNDDTNFLSSPIKYDTTGASVTSSDAYGTYNDYSQIQRGTKGEFRTSGDKLATLLGVDIRANEYENKAHINQDYCSSLNFRTGGCSTVATAGTVTQNDTTDESVNAIYGEAKYALTDNFVITTNARYDNIKLDYTDTLNSVNVDKSFDVGSYRVGATYITTPTTSIYTNISTGFRAPTIDQLFAGDINPTGTTLSNQDLKPEKSLTYELGYRGYFDLSDNRYDFDMAVFQIDRDDYIMSNAGQYSKVTSTATSKYENIGGMRNKGFELSVNTDKSRTFFYNLAYSYLDAKFTKYDNFNLGLGNPYSSRSYRTVSYNLTGNVVPRTSKHNLNLEANMNATSNLLLTSEVNAKSSYYADELNWVEIPGQAVLNLMATYKSKYKNYDWNFFVRVDNALDKFYYNTARGNSDSDYDGDFDAEDISIVVNQGRTYTAGLSMKF